MDRHIDIASDQVIIAHRRLGPGRVTIAWILCRGGDGLTVRYAVSFCSPNDQFCRRAGRLKAVGRLQSRRQSYAFDASPLLARGDEKVEVIVEAILQQLALPAAWGSLPSDPNRSEAGR